MKTALLFPGQGSDIAGQGRDWFEASEPVRSRVEDAARRAGAEVGDLFRPSRRTLPTEILEPVHTALCLGVYGELRTGGVEADVIAGHSLGEIPACAAAGCCGAEAAIELAAERGRLMAREAARHPGGIVQLVAPTRDAADEAVAFAREAGMAAVATHNLAEIWGISGEWDALRHLATRHPVTTVPVEGPWHSDALAGAVTELENAARRALTQPIRVPLVVNRTGDFVERTEDLPRLLADQLTHTVLWVRSLETLAAAGVTDFVTVGPGRILRSLVLHNLGRKARVHSTDSRADLDRTVEALRA